MTGFMEFMIVMNVLIVLINLVDDQSNEYEQVCEVSALFLVFFRQTSINVSKYSGAQYLVTSQQYFPMLLGTPLSPLIFLDVGIPPLEKMLHVTATSH